MGCAGALSPANLMSVAKGQRPPACARESAPASSVRLETAREQTLEEVRRKSVTALSKARGGDPILDEEVARLHKALLDCLSGDKASRDRLRSWVPAASMGQLQKILKALESEKEYQNYRRTEKLFKTLFDSNV